MFRQEIKDGYQVECPTTGCCRPDPWEAVRYPDTVEVKINSSIKVHNDVPHLIRNQPTTLRGIPYDRPVVGYGGKTINSLRLWGAFSPSSSTWGSSTTATFSGLFTPRSQPRT